MHTVPELIKNHAVLTTIKFGLKLLHQSDLLFETALKPTTNIPRSDQRYTEDLFFLSLVHILYKPFNTQIVDYDVCCMRMWFPNESTTYYVG